MRLNLTPLGVFFVLVEDFGYLCNLVGLYVKAYIANI